jgi:hypothetical protein
MAPRLPETFEAFEARARQALEKGQAQVRYGLHHHSHALCSEDGVFRVRQLETTAEEAEAYLKEHGIFMPEHNEEIAKPRTLLFEASTLDEVLAWIGSRWAE